MRPLEQGAKAAARDVSTLTHVLKRVTENTEERQSSERDEIAGHLRSAITLLMRWTETPRLTNNGKGKAGLEKPRPRAER